MRTPGAILVIGLAGVLLTPGIHQGVAGPAVKTQGRMRGPQDADVGHAPHVQHHHRFLRAFKQGLVEGWHQWGALPASGHIAAAKISHHVNARQLSQQGRCVELQCVTQFWPMANGLTMGANGADLGRRHSGSGANRLHHLRATFHQILRGQCGLVQFVRTGCVERQQDAFEGGIQRLVSMGQRAPRGW